MTGKGHNSGGAVTADRLRSFVERVERINTEIADLNADKAEVFKEAKGEGFDVPTLKKVIAIRAKDPNQVAEQTAMVETYLAALGGPLVHAHARDC